MIAAIVLAAGSSSRFGRPKPLLPAGDRTFLDTILGTLREAGVETVRVVLGARAGEILAATRLADAEVVINPEPERGMIASLRCGIRALPRGTGGFALWPVDHPLVRPGTVVALAARFEARGGTRIVVPIHDGSRGHPVLFPRATIPELLDAPDAEGARAVVRREPGRVDEVVCDDPGVVADIDTPEAYEQAFGRSPGGPIP